MKEKLSAIIDGEFEDEIHVHITRLRSDPELRAAWDTYHLIGDALRGHMCREIAPRVVSRLREEPTVLAPRPRAGSTARRIGWYGMYAAASAAAVAVVAWTAFPGWHTDPQLAAGAVATTAEIPAESVAITLPAAEVEDYLLAHQPYSHVSAMQGVAPYVRSVSEERVAASK
ncbi:MAG TPA: sigma-E factor negative regulatory protein [Burkholderiales bacterium]|nr:sigma-E factor negative regulatory protein [Burkholderiales bacterium]